MPITQNRMLSILAAARDYQLGLSRVAEYIEQAVREYEKGKLTAEQTITRIISHSRPGLVMQHPEASAEVIAAETAHFARERRRNDRKAEKLRENRMNLALGHPAPNRGDGREFGKLGAAKSRPVLGHIEPNPTVHRPRQLMGGLESTDSDQINSDSELDLEQAQTSAGEFLSQLDENGNIKKG